jgi:hypothetical protein
MSRPKKKPIREIILDTILNESFNSEIKTKFKMINFGDYIACRFNTDSGNEYDLEFHEIEESCDTILGGLRLGDILNIKKSEVRCFSIAFTLSNIVNKDNPFEFEMETNLNEPYELMGRIVYICKSLIKLYKNIRVFVIGGNVKRNRLSIYKNVLKNNFEGYFDVFEGHSSSHGDNSLFIITK